MYMNEMMR